jgi:iron(III) transport system substrate-binding protein
MRARLHRPFGRRCRIVAAALLLSLAGAGGKSLAAAEVNVYSYRQPFLIQPLLDAFTRQTGIAVNVVYADKGVLERLKAEGANTPADAVLTADVGNLNDLVEAELLQPVRSDVLVRNVPPQYRHPDGLWYGLTTRARVIYASRDRVAAESVARYEDLADPRFRGRVCSRSGKHVYMISLIAAMIAHQGEAATAAWLEGVKANLARRPQGNDRGQAKAIFEGECDVAIGNTYYVGAMMTNAGQPEEKAWAEAIRIVFPNQNDRGTHVNISGAAVTRSAKNRDNAVQLIEFLSSDAAQQLYASADFEYPVKPGTPLSEVVASWGAFRADPIPLAEVAKYRTAASRLVDRVGFDLGGGS